MAQQRPAVQVADQVFEKAAKCIERLGRYIFFQLRHMQAGLGVGFQAVDDLLAQLSLDRRVIEAQKVLEVALVLLADIQRAA